MKKQKKLTISAVVILALLIVVYFIMPLLEKEESNTTASEKILILNKDDIYSIDFSGAEEELSFSRNVDSGLWTLIGYEDREVDTTYMNAVLNVSCNLPIVTRLEGVSDYSQYGFDEPANIISVKTQEKTHTIIFGCHNTTSSVYYVMVDDDPTVYVYSHSVTLPYDYEAEHFLVEIPDTTEEEAEDSE